MGLSSWQKLLLIAGTAGATLTLTAVVSRMQAAGTITLAWVKAMLIAWKPAAWQPLNFTLQMSRASYDNVSASQNTLAVLQANLAFLLSMNPTSIRIDVGYDAFATGNATAIANLDAIVAAVRAAGKQLIIADAAREYYRKHPEPWVQFQADWAARVQALATRYHPDHYIVIKEPGWYAPMISDIRTNLAAQEPSSWAALLLALSDTVKTASPTTKVGISIAMTANQMSVLHACLPFADFVGLDLYTEGDYSAADAFVFANPTSTYWLAELWSATSGGFDAARAQLDQEWVEMAYDFALLEGAVEMNLFYSDNLCDYNLNGQTNPATIVAEYQQKTTLAYATYKALIAGTIPVF